MLDKDFQVPECACPECGKIMDGVSNVAGTESPEPGDVTVCICCATLMKFTDTMTLERLVGAERTEALKDVRVVATILAINKIRKWKEQSDGSV